MVRSSWIEVKAKIENNPAEVMAMYNEYLRHIKKLEEDLKEASKVYQSSDNIHDINAMLKKIHILRKVTEEKVVKIQIEAQMKNSLMGGKKVKKTSKKASKKTSKKTSKKVSKH